MVISTTSSQTIALGNGVTTAFTFPFVGAAATDIQVIYNDATGAQTTLASTLYTLILNSASTNQIWGIGGTVIYPLSGSPIATGTYLSISRILPLTQVISINNQGDFAPMVIEEAIDTLCMEIQQVSARTGLIRGTWITGVAYNYGDIVIDGANGLNSGNYYFCAIANTSGTWTTDLAAGDWSLAIPSTLPAATLPLSIGNGGTGASTAATARTALGLGTIATQDSSNVTITGGIISANSFSPISATVPANGIYLVGTNKVGISANSALGFQVTYETGTGTPVNNIQSVNVGSGFFPYLEAIGSDASPSFVYVAKGSGGHFFNTNGPRQSFADVTQFAVLHTANATRYVTATGSNGAAPAVGTSAGDLSLGSTTNSIQLNANLAAQVATYGLTLKQGANGRYGSFTLTGATPVTVNNTTIATTDIVSISLNKVGGTVGAIPHLATITAASGFTVVGTTADISIYNYSIVKSAL